MTCEEARIGAMALADGEAPPISRAEIEAHLSACAECRREVEALAQIGRMLERQHRRQYDADLWPAIERRLEPARTRIFVVLAAALLAYKLAVFVPDREFGLWVEIIPLAVAVVFFFALRENPFRVNAELRIPGGDA